MNCFVGCFHTNLSLHTEKKAKKKQNKTPVIKAAGEEMYANFAALRAKGRGPGVPIKEPAGCVAA